MPEISTLKSGVRVISKTLPQTSSVGIAIFVGTGGRYEDLEKNYGVTHFLEHLLFKGTTKRPNPKQIPEEIDGVGGYINAYTTEDRTCFYVKLPRQHWRLGLDILSDLIQHPLFNEKEIDRERGVILEEMNVSRDDPSRFVYDLVGDLLWPTDTLRTNVIGTEQIISSIPKSKIVDYYKKQYTLQNVVVSIAGNLEKWEIEEAVAEQFTSSRRHLSISAIPTKGPIAKKRINLLSSDTNQSHFVLCARGPEINHEDEVPMRLLSAVLGSGLSSRLSLNVRERKGLAYTIYSSTSFFSDSGSFEIYAGVNKDKLAQALRAVISEIHKVASVAIPDKELEKVKELSKGRLIMSQEDTSSIADRMGSQIILAGRAWSTDESLAKIDAVTAAQIKRVAKKYLAPAKLRLALLGPHEPKELPKYEQILTG